MGNYYEMLGKIKNRENFIEFMHCYISDTEDTSVRCYLESLTAWADDMEGYYKNSGIEMPEGINWDFIATLLYAGSIYE